MRAGLLLLLTSCGWITGGEEGAKRAVASAGNARYRAPPHPNAQLAHCSIRKLLPSDAPELFAEIDAICWRAKLDRHPEICILVGQRAMNAYASSGPGGAVVTFTEGLLRGMTTKEAAAIFAHEIAHICNGDSATMSWAGSMQQAINDIAAYARTSSDARASPHKTDPSLRGLLQCAPAIAELLMLALSRFRELEADALALELTGDAKTLESALAKLEHHHRAMSGIPAHYIEDRISSYLRSHPATSDRICQLRTSSMFGAA